MARPNYSFEKRQRELKKNRKKEEKRQKKAARQTDGDDAPTEDSERPAGDSDPG